MSGWVQVLTEDPELSEHLNGTRLSAAERDCVARVIDVSPGRWAPPPETESMRLGIGLLVLDGMLVRREGIAGRFGAELLGAGELLRPWQREGSLTALPQPGVWQALRRSRVAILDGEFTTRIARYPEVVASLFGRAVRRSRLIAVNMAIVHQPRIDLRLHMLFWELADRWGTVHQDGIHLTLPLTHAMLAELVAARRPTVTKALGELAQRSVVAWTGQHWLLSSEPPTDVEMAETASVSVTRAE